jgi:hypothetical protein
MNVQLQFQMLINEALSEDIPVNTAKRVEFDSAYGHLVVTTAQRKYLVTLRSAEEKARMQKYHAIITGPTAFKVTTHAYEIKQRDREALTFECPTFGECTPREAKHSGDYINVLFSTMTEFAGGHVRFTGVAQLGRDVARPVAGMPVFGEYHKYTQTGWMRPDMYSGLEVYVC